MNEMSDWHEDDYPDWEEAEETPCWRCGYDTQGSGVCPVCEREYGCPICGLVGGMHQPDCEAAPLPPES